MCLPTSGILWFNELIRNRINLIEIMIFSSGSNGIDFNTFLFSREGRLMISDKSSSLKYCPCISFSFSAPSVTPTYAAGVTNKNSVQGYYTFALFYLMSLMYTNFIQWQLICKFVKSSISCLKLGNPICQYLWHFVAWIFMWESPLRYLDSWISSSV